MQILMATRFESAHFVSNGHQQMHSASMEVFITSMVVFITVSSYFQMLCNLVFYPMHIFMIAIITTFTCLVTFLNDFVNSDL